MSAPPVPPVDQRIVVRDIDIPFGRLVAFFVKASLAAIPAVIIVWIIVMLIWFVVMVIAGLLGMSFRPGWMMHRW